MEARSQSLRRYASYLRSFVFGVEDSLVSTVGLLSGIKISGTPQGFILLAGVIYILVEAFAMAAGNFLSEQAADDYDREDATASLWTSLATSVVMFFSFVIAGFIPLLPYLLNTPATLFVSIGLSLIVLFVIGMVSAKVVHRNPIRRGIEMALVGGAAIAVGIIAGKLVGIS